MDGDANIDVKPARGGDDFLDGGEGNDVLPGGGGSDKFPFTAGTGIDVIATSLRTTWTRDHREMSQKRRATRPASSTWRLTRHDLR